MLSLAIYFRLSLPCTASGSYYRLQRVIEQSLRLTLYMGVFFGLVFALSGEWLGAVLYDSASAGHYIVLLSIVCPFFYLQSVLGGLMNGLELRMTLWCIQSSATEFGF